MDLEQDCAFSEFVKTNFNWVVDTYRMKWKPSEPQQGVFDSEIPDKMISWAEGNNLTVRGHALLWSKKSNNPSWVWNLYGQDLIDAMYDRVETAVTHYQDKVVHWDVINEMIDIGGVSHRFYTEQTGDPDIRNKMFHYANELSPETTLFLNDYGIVNNKNGRFAAYQQMIRQFLADGAPVQAIGLQSHITGEIVNVDLMKNIIEELWEEFNLPIWITEFSWSAGDIE